MTGYECLKEELKNRGFSNQQINSSKMLPVLLDILANSNGEYISLYEAQCEADEARKKAEREREAYKELIASKEHLERLIQDMADRRYARVEEYIKKFFAALDACEMPEGRDAIRRAQLFVNSVDVDTKYDNTAFIIGLSAILTNGAIAPIDELHKINKKIPSLELCSNYRGGYSIEEIGEGGFKKVRTTRL